MSRTTRSMTDWPSQGISYQQVTKTSVHAGSIDSGIEDKA
jgi:hypothetical protein